MKHLTDEQLSARLDRALSGRALEEAERHLAGCAQCRDALAVLAAHDRFLGAALVHDPGEEYFATFAARVEDRLRAEGLRGAQARLSHDQAPWIRWFNAPRRVAWTAAVATIVAGAAIVILTTREDRMPPLERDPTLTRITAQSAPPPSSDRSARAAQAPAESYGAKEANPDNGRPVDAVAKNQAAPEKAKTRARQRDDAMALAPGPENLDEGTGASPSRMRPVPGATATPPEPRLTAQTAPEPPAAPAPEGRGVHVVKRNYAQPLQDKDVAANQAKQAEGMREEASAPKLQSGAGTPSSGVSNFANVPPSAGALVAPASRPGEVQLCGRIVDGQGRAVAHASIALVTIGRTATTSESGDFCMSAPDGSYELSVMAVGFQTSRMQVRVAGERSDVRVTLNAISVLDGLAKTEQTRRLQESQSAPMSTTTGGAKADAQKPAPADAKKTTASTAPANAPTNAKEPPKDPFAGETKAGAQAAATAMSATRYAATYPTLPTWTKAAETWGAAAEAVKTPTGRGEALYRIAEARVNVWRQYPTPTRKNDALATCNTVLSGTPTPEQRKDVIRWMNEVRRGPTGRD